MRTHQVVAGFSDLKSEFIDKTRTKTPADRLILWFTFEDQVLCVHESSAPTHFMIIALYNAREKRWRLILRNNGAAEGLVRNLTARFDQATILNAISALYQTVDNYC